MSFASIFHKIESVAVGAERIAAPIAEMLLPQYAVPIQIGANAIEKAVALDPTFQAVQNTIIKTEIKNPASGQGAPKLDQALATYQAMLDEINTFLAPTGKKLIADGAELTAGINAQVEAFNHFAKVKATLQLVDIAGLAAKV